MEFRVTDDEMIEAIQAGDEAAFERMYQRYLPVVWRYAYARLHGDIHGAEDVTSETFLAVVRSIGTIGADRGSFPGWLMGIARHKVADCARRARKSVSVRASGTLSTASQADGPLKSLEKSEMRAAIA